MRSTLMSVLSLSMLAGTSLAQSQGAASKTTAGSGVTTTTDTTKKARVYVRPEAETLSRMMKTVSVSFQESTLESSLNFLQSATGADLEIMWLGDNDSSGLTKETLISAKADNLTALRVLEIILERADVASGNSYSGGSTWQMSDTGALQIGPRERLNKFKRTEIYDVSDLVLEVPNYDDAPTLDLQQALQASQRGGGGGGQSTFTNTNNNNQSNTRPLETRTQEVVELITTIVESEQWQENGGDGGSIRVFQGKALVVKAPDYMHRGINGYPYWPSESTTTRMVGGRRYVSLGVDTATSIVGKIENANESAVVGGTIVRVGGGGGPGGSEKPKTPAAQPGKGAVTKKPK